MLLRVCYLNIIIFYYDITSLDLITDIYGSVFISKTTVGLPRILFSNPGRHAHGIDCRDAWEESVNRKHTHSCLVQEQERVDCQRGNAVDE